MRVLGRVRLSRSTEESTSVERQREAIEQWASLQGHEIIGWAEDLDISGGMDPFTTPGLGPWLTDEHLHQWDVLAAWKLDRISRQAIPMGKLFGWLQEHQKTLICTADSIDLSTPMGRLIAYVIATIAEGELEAIRERTSGSQLKIRQLGRWHGGKPAYGLHAVERAGGGYELQVDRAAAEVINRIADMLLEGSPIGQIADRLNQDGTPTPTDHYRSLKGKPGKRTRWATPAIRSMLRNPALIGQRVHVNHARECTSDGGAWCKRNCPPPETVRGDDGLPIKFSESVMPDSKWHQVQQRLDQIAGLQRSPRQAGASALSGIVFCGAPTPGGGICGATLHKSRVTSRGVTHDYYKCPRTTAREAIRLDIPRCISSSIPADYLEELTEQRFLEEVGHLKIIEKVWIEGDGRDEQLQAARDGIEELAKAAGRAKSDTARELLQRQIANLDEQLAELESAPTRKAGWEHRETPTTYTEAWNSGDTDERRELLRKSGIRVEAYRRIGTNSYQFSLEAPQDMVERFNHGISQTDPGDIAVR